MDTLKAYKMNKQAKERGDSCKYMDFYKLFKLMDKIEPDTVSIGLKDDEEYTMGMIIKDGDWNDDYYFVYSYWATPIAVIDGMIFDLETTKLQLDKRAYENNVIDLKDAFEKFMRSDYEKS